MTTFAVKDALRSAMLRRRAGFGPEDRAALGAALLALGPAVARRFAPGHGAVVSAFFPIRDEPDARPLLAALHGAGFVAALPVTPPRGQPLRFRAWHPGGPLRAGRFGTFEPPDDAAEVDPDVLFVPLAAFDRHGFRLGYGAGYYDGALHRLRRSKPIFAVGVAFTAQEVEAVPTEPHDERLDAVLTERGLLTVGPDPCASSSSAT